MDENGYEAMKKCICTIKKEQTAILKSSGIAEGFRSKRLDNFNTQITADEVTLAKQMAMDYVAEFKTIRKDRNNSIAFYGCVGSGKTHLSIGIANELLEMGIPVRYMEYRKVIDKIKRNRLDNEFYYKHIMRYKNVEVLLIDDLFKGAFKGGELNPSDLGIMYDIINHRYMEHKPIIVSSELRSRDLTNCDEAIGSRVAEMCKGRTIEISKGKNYRLKGGL